MFQKNHVRKQGLEHVHVPVLFVFFLVPVPGKPGTWPALV